jgi:hypothetical protein
MIGEFHKFRAGQLWNTIDERFLDPRYLPEEWDDPEFRFTDCLANLAIPDLSAVGQNRKHTNYGHAFTAESRRGEPSHAQAQFWTQAADGQRFAKS